MKTILDINSILIYSEETDRFFHSEFSKKLNVIYGKNTAGKSTLIQLILFAFGINDNKIKLTEILSENIFTRLDCTITNQEGEKKYVFIRQDETLVVKDNNERIIRFNGISSDNAAEHIKLKKYFNALFNFNLLLESNSGVSEAPIETIFLPYYVSQEVGWVYLRKSFSNLTFYKNFKEDFLDYYLGVENVVDREAKRGVEQEINRLNQQIKFYIDAEKDNEDLKLSKIIDQTLHGKANELITEISQKNELLLNLENEFVSESNNLTFYNQRLSVVSKVRRNHNNQEPAKDSCPTCTQILPSNIEDVYSFFQEENDTTKIERDLKVKIKSLQSRINQYKKKIEINRDAIKSSYISFNKYSENELTLEKYIDSKANFQLIENIKKQIGQLNINLSAEKEKLKDYKTEDDIVTERLKKSKIFKEKYQRFNTELGLPSIDDERFYQVYDISSFPFQGVQLHLAVLSYHFAFNYLLTQTSNIHRLPFILDSVFKEDIEGGNKIKILKFINSNYPKDTQVILSIADDKNVNSTITQYQTEIFKDNANMICIGDGVKEKSLLIKNDDSKRDLIRNSFKILETV